MIADLVGWVKERNPTSILLLVIFICWVSSYSTQPIVINFEVTADFLSHAEAQRHRESFESLVILKILLLRERENLNLLVFNSDTERITQWIP